MTQHSIKSAAERIPVILRELDGAIVSGQAAQTFDHYTLDDYLFTSPSGTLNTKPQVLEALRSGAARFTSYSTTDIQVCDYGSIAIVHGITAGKGVNPGGEIFHGRYRFTSVWVDHEGDWRLAAWQATAIV